MLSQQETNIKEKKHIFKICILLSDVYKKKHSSKFYVKYIFSTFFKQDFSVK